MTGIVDAVGRTSVYWVSIGLGAAGMGCIAACLEGLRRWMLRADREMRRLHAEVGSLAVQVARGQQDSMIHSAGLRMLEAVLERHRSDPHLPVGNGGKVEPPRRSPLQVTQAIK